MATNNTLAEYNPYESRSLNFSVLPMKIQKRNQETKGEIKNIYKPHQKVSTWDKVAKKEERRKLKVNQQTINTYDQ